ncbi:MAG: hypothetical protein WA160_14690 [Pseudobdellovibrio sp.]
MNNIYLFLRVAGLSILFTACQGQKKFEVVNWSEGQPTSAVKKIDNLDSNFVHNTKTKFVAIENSIQRYEGFEIENSFIKKSYVNGTIKNISAQVFNPKNLNKKKITQFDLTLSQDFLQLKLLQSLGIQEKIQILKVKPVLVVKKDEVVPYWKADYIDRIGVPWAYYLDSDFKLIEKVRVGSQFNEISALVFPTGPKLSVLTDVILSNLKSQPIANDQITVVSESPYKINSMSQPLNFAIDDFRFDQVQVFYYINKSLDWFKSNFQIERLQNLEAVVHIGYPEKTNSAFYYQGRIRIGAGDGITYNRIPKDPSIVIHESVHSIVEQVAGLPYEGAGGSLNEAFCDFFTAVQLQNPNMGEVAFLKGPFKRSLETRTNLSEATAGLYHDSIIISGLLWQLQKNIAQDKITKVAFITLTKLNLISDFNDFSYKLKSTALENLTADEYKIVQAELSQRGF